MTSRATRLIDATAERLAQILNVPSHSREAFRQTVASVMASQLQAMCDPTAGSGRLRLYPRKMTVEARAERDARIRVQLAAGIAPEQVAHQVGCSRRHVYSVRQEQAGAQARANLGP